jgi:2-dehydropantoate 2-reductase
MPKITLIGPGAIGGLVATWLCQDEDNDVTVCARTPIRLLTLESPYGSIEAHPKVMTEAGQLTAADWVMVATKAYDSETAAAWFTGLVDDRTTVAIIQNGVDHVERFSAWLPADQILPVMIDCPTERTNAETIQQRGPASMVVPASDMGTAFTGLFANTRIEAKTDPDFLTVAWRKLCINSAGAINAITLEPARIAHNPHAASLMRNIVRETIAVGRAEGANLDDTLADEVISAYRAMPGDSLNSLHADRLAGRSMETALRNGVIVRLGRKYGIPTPFNEMAVGLLESIATTLV